MCTSKAFEEIRKMDLPGKVKAELMMLWAKFRSIGDKIMAFIRRHKDLAECLLLGAIVAFLIGQVPWLGGFLALLALVTAASVGLMLEMRNYLMAMFSESTIPA
jgi:hypothetical protein